MKPGDLEELSKIARKYGVLTLESATLGKISFSLDLPAQNTEIEELRREVNDLKNKVATLLLKSANLRSLKESAHV